MLNLAVILSVVVCQMSANPHLFSEEDMTSYRWKSKSCTRYTRLRGFKQQNILGRVQKILQK